MPLTHVFKHANALLSQKFPCDKFLKVSDVIERLCLQRMTRGTITSYSGRKSSRINIFGC